MHFESSLLCEGLQNLDKYGLLPQMPKKDPNTRASTKLTPQFSVNFISDFNEVMKKKKDIDNKKDEENEKETKLELNLENVKITKNLLSLMKELSELGLESEEDEESENKFEENKSKKEKLAQLEL